MHARLELFRKHGMHAPLTLNAAKAGERGRHDRNTEMGFAFGARASVSRMAVGLVLDDKRDRRKRRLELGLYGFRHAHDEAQMGNKMPKVKQEVFLSSLPSFGILGGLWLKEQRARQSGRTTCA